MSKHLRQAARATGWQAASPVQIRTPSRARSTRLVLAAIFALAGCASNRPDIPYSPAGFTAPDQPRAIETTQVRRLAPLDVVSVAVFQAPEVSGDRRIDDQGNIVMPLVGSVTAQGRTPEELATTLRAELSEYYIRPDIVVTLKESPTSQVTVDGSVGAPGVYSVVGPITLMQAVALARGATEDANLRRVVVFRSVGGQRMAAAFDLQAIRNAAAADPTIYSADVIVVDGNRTRRVLRDLFTALPLIALFRPF